MKILPKLRQIFRKTSNISELKKSTSVVSKTSESAAKVNPNSSETNPFLNYIYETYGQDGVSKEIVDRVVLGGERLRYYRYVGQEELQKLLSGSRITSSRPCHNGTLTDVTSNPNYGNIPTIGKYRLTFKDKPEFCPYPLGNERNSRILEHNLGNQEFYLRGGYDISDIEKIEQKIDKNTFRKIDIFG